MYVDNDAFPVYPAVENLAIFYTSGTGAAAVHQYRFALAASAPVGSWSNAVAVLPVGSSVGLPGDVAPGLTVWPAPSASGSSYSSTGYACGVFPGILSAGPTRPADLNCYQKSTNRWQRLPLFHIDTAMGGRPALAFHTLRAASGAPLSDARGQFWITTIGTLDTSKSPYVPYNYPRLFVSTEVSAANPPSASLVFYEMQSSWSNYQGKGIALYADRDVSAIKALSIQERGDPVTLELEGIFDGAVHAELKGGDDFNLMEHGICRGVRDSPTGGSWCGNPGYFGYSL